MLKKSLSFICLASVCGLLFLPAAASGDLQRIPVTKASQPGQNLGFSLSVTDDPYAEGVYAVQMDVPMQGALKNLFGAGIFIGSGDRSAPKPLLADVPLEPRSSYSHDSAYSVHLRLSKTLFEQSTLYLRCGSPLLEVQYAIDLASYAPLKQSNTLSFVHTIAAPSCGSLPLYPGLEMTAALDKAAYKVGEPVVLRVNIRNTTPHVVVLGNGAGEHASFDFLVRNKDGKALPLTPYGRHLQTAPFAVARCANPLIKVVAGHTRGYHFDLTPMFGLQTPGEYSVVVSRGALKENDRSAAHGQYQIIAKPVFFTVQRTP